MAITFVKQRLRVRVPNKLLSVPRRARGAGGGVSDLRQGCSDRPEFGTCGWKPQTGHVGFRLRPQGGTEHHGGAVRVRTGNPWRGVLLQTCSTRPTLFPTQPFSAATDLGETVRPREVRESAGTGGTMWHLVDDTGGQDIASRRRLAPRPAASQHPQQL